MKKLSNIVFTKLEGAILSSELPPGARLNVAKIAGELDVSATPVREAIDQLCSRELVRAEQRGDGKYSNYYVFDIEKQLHRKPLCGAQVRRGHGGPISALRRTGE